LLPKASQVSGFFSQRYFLACWNLHQDRQTNL